MPRPCRLQICTASIAEVIARTPTPAADVSTETTGRIYAESTRAESAACEEKRYRKVEDVDSNTNADCSSIVQFVTD